jgi:hypothetical protein
MQEEVPVGKFGYVHQGVLGWLKGHLTVTALAAVCLMGGLIGASRMVGWMQKGREADLISADLIYQKWRGDPEGLQKIEKWLTRHPELRAKYGAEIAHKLLFSSQGGLAEGYASAALKKLQEVSPHYAVFSRGSLMIAEGKLPEALEAAKGLKRDMEGDTSFWDEQSRVLAHGALLYGYNLIRIAVLEGQVGTPEGELVAWKEFKQRAGWTDVPLESKISDPEAYQMIEKNFRIEELTLHDYIADREQKLKPSSS